MLYMFSIFAHNQIQNVFECLHVCFCPVKKKTIFGRPENGRTDLSNFCVIYKFFKNLFYKYSTTINLHSKQGINCTSYSLFVHLLSNLFLIMYL